MSARCTVSHVSSTHSTVCASMEGRVMNRIAKHPTRLPLLLLVAALSASGAASAAVLPNASALPSGSALPPDTSVPGGNPAGTFANGLRLWGYGEVYYTD